MGLILATGNLKGVVRYAFIIARKVSFTCKHL